MHPHESLIRTHVEGEGSERERQEVDEHLKGCSDCREFLSFAQDFSETAKDLAGDEIAADEPHASKSVIIAYEEGKLDAETALHLRSHMLFCDQCAEAYYLLKRMHAPSWTEVVIGVIQRTKDTLLEALEITGMGELIPVPATVTRGAGEELEAGESRIEIAQHVTDSDEEADVLLSIEPAESAGSVRIRIDMEPPQSAWRAKFLSPSDEEIASIPLSRQSQLLHSGVTPARFTVQVVHNEQVLAEYRVRIQASE
jgi:hypothetical protein